MNPMLKWIGGATAAVVLALAAVTLAGGMASGDDSETDSAASLDQAIPVDEAKLAEADIADGETVEPAIADDSAAAASETEPQPAAASEESFTVKRILPIEGPIKYGEWHWNEDGAPADGTLIVTVDLDARVISVFRDGYEIGAAAVLLGTQDHPTPLGTFPILQKKRHNVSSIYNVPMPYTMRLTWDGIAIHASEVENGYASHGCIGTPEPFAAKLFAAISKGDKVIITRGEMMQMGDTIL